MREKEMCCSLVFSGGSVAQKRSNSGTHYYVISRCGDCSDCGNIVIIVLDYGNDNDGV